MKRFFVCFAVLTAMVFMIGCGGSDNNSSGGSSSTSVCSYGEYECHGDDSYYCGYSGNDLMWLPYEKCYHGCNYYSGKCYWESDGDENNDNNECSNGDKKCVYGDSSLIYECKNGKWNYKCNAKYSCFVADPDNDTDSFACADDNNEDTEPEHICNNGEFKCSGNARLKCQSNNWEFYETCANGCSNNKCNSCTPQCSGKECGLDGCGGTCGNCDAGYDCSSAGQCVKNNSCSNHDDCVDGGMICYQNYCQSPWNKQWKVTFKKAEVTEKKSNGDCWDGDITGLVCDLPDLFATVEVNGAKYYQTSVKDNSTSANWNNYDSINFSASTDNIKYCLYDEDLSEHDKIGCWEHEFEFFTYFPNDSIEFTNSAVETFEISIEPAW